jgi:hypothetical protein
VRLPIVAWLYEFLTYRTVTKLPFRGTLEPSGSNSSVAVCGRLSHFRALSIPFDSINHDVVPGDGQILAPAIGGAPVDI